MHFPSGAARKVLTEAQEQSALIAKKLLQRTRCSANYAVDRTLREVSRYPGRSVAISFGVGACLGSLVGLAFVRANRRPC